MGDHHVHSQSSDEARLDFIGHLLDDLKSLQYMLRVGMIEDDIIRIGAEQELCLVNDHWRPANNALDIFKSADDPHFALELALYNLEINLDPEELTGAVFKKMERQLTSLLEKAEKAAARHDTKTLLAGILPTISKHELDLKFMTPEPRYFALNELLTEVLGSDFRMHFTGVDELSIAHNSMMFEACNTSFQMHLQVRPAEFAMDYNWAQAIAGPVLAACTNSPLLMGNELWSETRIALFQQSIDTRKISRYQNKQQARVAFGSNWVSGSIADFYKKDISKYRILLTKKIEKNSLEELENGVLPKLSALNLHNGTIYRWNRPCYGTGNGKPHIRIENRYIPAGPTLADEMANFVFWVGLMKGRPQAYDFLQDKMDFAEAKSNFIKAARYGAESIMNWMGKKTTVERLILEELLPMAETGLGRMKVDPEDIDKYLGIIRNRISTQTGSEWIVKNYRHLRKSLKTDDALIALTEGIYTNQHTHEQVSEWPDIKDASVFDSRVTNVRHIMSRSLVTADLTDSARLTLQYMKWNNIHHLPVVDRKEKLVGLITWTHLEDRWASTYSEGHILSAADIMIKEVITVDYTTPIDEAVSMMKMKNIGCLPVLQDGLLMGIITKRDLTDFGND
ncbi:MAG: CBS domain-containing protein [Cyclobacteriaceae bacterium]